MRGERKDGRNGEVFGGRDVAKATLLLTGLGAAYVGWKYVKHNWLVEHGYLPEWMRDYWVVYAIVIAGFIVWGAVTRFRT